MMLRTETTSALVIEVWVMYIGEIESEKRAE